MDGIAPYPPKNPPSLKKGGPSRRMSVSLSSAGGMARRGSITQSKTGLYSSGMYSSKIMKGATHGLGEKHGGGGAGKAHQVQVFDADGNDVTPLSLLPPPKPSGYKGGSHSVLAEGAKSGLASESAADFLNNLESMTIASQFNTSAFGRSMYASKASGASMSDKDDDDASSLASAESDLEDDDAVEYRKKEVEVKHFTEAELAAPVSILLSETETIWLLEIPGVSVASDSPDEPVVKAANEKYKELKATRSTNDNFVDKATQTFNYVRKNKDVQATVLKQAHAECMVNEWSIYDTFVSREGKSTESSADIDHNKDASTGDDDSIDNDGRLSSAGPISASTLQSIQAESAMLSGSVNAIGASMSMGIDATGTMNQSIMGGDYGDAISVAGSAAAENPEGGRLSLDLEVTLQDSMIDTLKLMEVNVTANNYLKKHVEYRDLPNLTAEKLKDDERRANTVDMQGDNETKGISNEAEEEKTDLFGSNLPTLQFLWSYRCDRTRDRTVNYLAWNKQNEDILAAAYSECQTYPNQSLGLIMCWSLKNPEYPDRIYKADSPVTTIAFSSINPNLLAAGFNDGRIAIYDIRNTTDRPVLDNGDLSGKHRDPVWELKWVEHERNIGDEQSHGETLVSISTDGRVVQWLIRKGLEFTDLMTLKRITKQEGNKGGSGSGANGTESSKSSAFISRQAGGLCFDFNAKDSNIYLAGTEDGHIHRCSCSYNEQYLDTYFGHTGPVYRVKWSPFYHQAFLSCSADWTARLWHQDHDEPVLKFQSGRDSITDVSWSPTCATVFGCVTRDGRIEIWDLQFSILDPAILHSVLDRKLTAIVFAEESPVVLTGDDTGQINVYKLRNVQSGVGKTRDEKAEILAGVMRSKKQIPA